MAHSSRASLGNDIKKKDPETTATDLDSMFPNGGYESYNSDSDGDRHDDNDDDNVALNKDRAEGDSGVSSSVTHTKHTGETNTPSDHDHDHDHDHDDDYYIEPSFDDSKSSDDDDHYDDHHPLVSTTTDAVTLKSSWTVGGMYNAVKGGLYAYVGQPLVGIGTYIKNNKMASGIGFLGAATYAVTAGINKNFPIESVIRVGPSAFSNTLGGAYFFKEALASLNAVGTLIKEHPVQGAFVLYGGLSAGINSAGMAFDAVADKVEEFFPVLGEYSSMVAALPAAIVLLFMGAQRLVGAKSLVTELIPDFRWGNKRSASQDALGEAFLRLEPEDRIAIQQVVQQEYNTLLADLQTITTQDGVSEKEIKEQTKARCHDYIMDIARHSARMAEQFHARNDRPFLQPYPWAKAAIFKMVRGIYTIVPPIGSLGVISYVGFEASMFIPRLIQEIMRVQQMNRDFAADPFMVDTPNIPVGSDWSLPTKYSVGLLLGGGLPLLVFWFGLKIKIPMIFFNAVEYFREFPNQIPIVSLMTFINAFSGMSFATSFLRMLSKPDHMMPFLFPHPINITTFTELKARLESDDEAVQADAQAVAWALLPIVAGPTIINMIAPLAFFKLGLPLAINNLDRIILYLRSTLVNELSDDHVDELRSEILPKLFFNPNKRNHCTLFDCCKPKETYEGIITSDEVTYDDHGRRRRHLEI